MDAEGWFDFLHSKFIPWKYPDRSRNKRHCEQLFEYKAYKSGLTDLRTIKLSLFKTAKSDVETCIKVADRIRGIGTCGASSLLAILFDEQFGGVNQWIIRQVCNVEDLPEIELIEKMRDKPQLSPHDGSIVIGVLVRKANELNSVFRYAIPYWRPRDIEMILCGHHGSNQMSGPPFLPFTDTREPEGHVMNFITTMTHDR